MNEEENIITLYDEDNNPVDFEHLDTFELDDSVYIVLLEILDDGRENDEVVIFRLEADDDGEDPAHGDRGRCGAGRCVCRV